MKKQYFNLIEIMLALGVIAIGMSSVLVLFPVGINSSNSATADNSVPDAAQYIAGYIEITARSEWRTTGKTGTRTSALLGNIPTAKPDSKSPSTWNEVENTPLSSCGTKGLFKYEQTHKVGDDPAVVDFSAEARVWKDEKNFIHVPGASAPLEMNAGSTTIYIEMSYPLTKPYEDREIQIYRFDLYDYGA